MPDGSVLMSVHTLQISMGSRPPRSKLTTACRYRQIRCRVCTYGQIEEALKAFGSLKFSGAVFACCGTAGWSGMVKARRFFDLVLDASRLLERAWNADPYLKDPWR